MSNIKPYVVRVPEKVEAIQIWTETLAEAEEWTRGRVVYEHDELLDCVVPKLRVVTKNRIQVAEISDYVLKDSEGYFYVQKCKPFELAYIQPRSRI